MKSKASIGRHPIHPMLVSLPIGLWAFSLIADILYLSGVHPHWKIVSAYSLAGGCVGAIFAALPGIIDYWFIKDKETKLIATWHMILNVCLVLVYCWNFMMRLGRDYEMVGLPFTLSVVSAVVLAVSGWLGGHLVYVHKMGVDEEETSTASRISSHLSERN